MKEPVQPVVVVVVMITAGLLDVGAALEVDGLLLELIISEVEKSGVVVSAVNSVEKIPVLDSLKSVVLVVITDSIEVFGVLEVDFLSTISSVVDSWLVVGTTDSIVSVVMELLAGAVEETVDLLAVEGAVEETVDVLAVEGALEETVDVLAVEGAVEETVDVLTVEGVST